MLDIRPVSDLRNKFSEIEKTVKNGQPVFLTKNGYGTMVVMSIEEYSRLTDPVEMALDLADMQAASSSKRLSAEEVFTAARKAVNG
ncbi:MAG: type II toxin-antitoxin system Phd/YefM family antitoxin [Erysipelotrichaceae bacterium]|nr:type II toxin-antitoxin system Phd/YefM family antitoxin [Erysipelotrichaceae bacterium]